MKSMTKEEIITGLKATIKPEEEYFIEDDLIDAINQYPEPFELVDPILEIIATNPRSILACQGIWFILWSSFINTDMKNY